MGLFDIFSENFRETIFLKEDSNLVEQINELESIKEKVSNKESIKKDIKLLSLGLKGENDIFYELKHSNLGLIVLRDIVIEFDGLKAQIDYVIISKVSIYLVECKNLIGDISVDSQGQFKREYVLDGKKIKEAIYSPYNQAVRHKEVIRKEWLSRKSNFSVALLEKNFDNIWYKPLVVIANHKSLLDIKHAPKEIKQSIVRVDQLINYIKKDLENYDRSYYSSQKDMESVANRMLALNTNNYYSIANKYNEKKINSESTDMDLTEKLKKFRAERSKQLNIPKYYIFTNLELEKLIENKPTNLDNLEGIIPKIKINCHGKEIIEIIKNN